MSDIDFDELDRAVTSVLNGGSTKRDEPLLEAHFETPEELAEEKTQAPEPVTVSFTKPAPVPVAAPIPEPVVKAAKPIAPPAQALHPIAQRPLQRGRFLDMVHPAHDMGVRTGTATKPLSGANVSQSTSQTFVGDVTSTAKATTETKQPANEEVVPATNSTPSSVKAAAETVPEKTEPADFFAGGPTPDKPTEPIVSPFIADAKVEKRPLGAFVAAESAALPVGDELHEKLVEVESEDNVIETAESPIPVAPEPTPVISPVAPPSMGTDKKIDSSLFGQDHLAKNRLDKAPKHGKGTLIWATVLIAVLLIGLGVGASLYFFVLNK